jgi:hypothetical protein
VFGDEGPILTTIGKHPLRIMRSAPTPASDLLLLSEIPYDAAAHGRYNA